MAVNDYNSTKKLEKASDFFSKLENLKEFEIKNEDGEIIFAASWAATFFANPKIREKVIKDFGYSPENAFTSKHTVEEVTDMCVKYAMGKRKFDGYQAEQARRLCNALLQYVEKLERNKPAFFGTPPSE